MSYGKEGSRYTLSGQDLFIKEKFLMSTTFAVVVLLNEIIGEETGNTIEALASALYEQIEESGPAGTEPPVAPAEGSAV